MLLTKAKNLAETSKDIISGFLQTGEIFTSNAEVRLAICRSCEFFFQNSCKICGCYMPLKTQFKYAKCDKNKW